MVAILGVLYIIMIFLDLKEIKKEKPFKKTMIVYMFITTINIVIVLLIVTNHRPPSPSDFIEQFFKLIGVE